MPTFVALSCSHCNAQFSRVLKTVNRNRKKGLRPFCSQDCQRAYRFASVVVQCAECGKDVSKSASQRRRAAKQKEASGRYFCGRSCSSTFRNRSRSGDKHPNFTGAVLSYRDRMAHKCSDCPESRKYLLTVHHVDGNRRNREKENEETVCFNCHAKRHMRFIRGQWRTDFKSLTPRELLSSL